MAKRAHMTDRTIAVSAAAVSCALEARVAATTLILVVSLVLLPGAVWMHAT